MTQPAPDGILYGRRKGRRLRAAQRGVLADLVPRLRIDLPPGESLIEPEELFARSIDQVWLEIGFGAGEHLLDQLVANPGVGFIGCEPFLNGVVRLASGLGETETDRLRVWQGDARVLLKRLSDQSVSRAFILFPDPWPKTRHHKRRIICPPVLADLARVMRDDAELRVATDDPGYLSWILERLVRRAEFAWTARTPADWRSRPSDWPETRYEQQAIAAGRYCTYLSYRRVASRAAGLASSFPESP